jgi:hypothetical protein
MLAALAPKLRLRPEVSIRMAVAAAAAAWELK